MGLIKDQLWKLKGTVTRIKAVIQDAEEQAQKQKQNHQIEDWLKKLREAVYDAEDLLDDFSTQVVRKQLMPGKRVSREVRLFLSRSNQFVYGLRMGHKVKALRERLYDIETDSKIFHFEVRDEERASLTNVREQTTSSEPEITVGRESDKEAVKIFLMNSNYEHNVSVISVVGMGGLGKTTLAQHVFNDEQVKAHFGVRLWVSVSGSLDVRKIIKGAVGQESNYIDEKIKKEIVERCQGVPLVIKAIARLMYLKDRAQWLSFIKRELPNRVKDDNIIDTLKLSYDPLTSYMKHCFAYCSLFPKGHRIDVKSLIQLWIAQGFVSSLNLGECLEIVGLRCFEHLLWRSFFHEVKKDRFGNIESCKMHDFMHDLATHVAGLESTIVDQQGNRINELTRHVSFETKLDWSQQIPIPLPCAKSLRTLVLFQGGKRDEGAWVSICQGFRRLRVLVLSHFGMKEVLPLIEKFKHLKYLDLSNNEMEALSNSVTSLVNLQVLKLNEECGRLKHIPPLDGIPSLEELEIVGLGELEYIDSEGVGGKGVPMFFPSLKRLEMRNCGRLKGWWKRWSRDEMNDDSDESTIEEGLIMLSFPRLSSLNIQSYPNLTSMPLFPTLDEGLYLRRTSSMPLQQTMKMTSPVSSSSSFTRPLSKLKRLHMWSIDDMESLPEVGLQNLFSLQWLSISECPRLKSLPLPDQGMHSLQRLEVDECRELKSLSESESQGMIPYLPSLQELFIDDCSEELSGRARGWGKEREEEWPPNIKHIPDIVIDRNYIQKEGRYVKGEGLTFP
uniref:Disease resistance protein RGA3 n=1 Tax=Populus alba TaxID=43335 RepID=A0A4V6A961_POPAL|nr:hypothetical protein D5086_0000128560 [Populus alba]